MRKSLKNRAIIPRSALPKKLSVMEDKLDELGYDTRAIATRIREQSRGRSRPGSRAATADAMDVDVQETPKEALLVKARLRSQSNRRENGITSMTARAQGERMAKLAQRKINRMARQGEADRHIPATRQKHLVSSGKATERATALTDLACWKTWNGQNAAAVGVRHVTAVPIGFFAYLFNCPSH